MTDRQETKKDIRGIYEELKGVLTSIQDNNSWFDDEGFTDHVNHIIARTASICPEIQDLDSYRLEKDYIPGREAIVHSIQAKSKLSALTGRLRGTYNLDVPTANSGHTFIQNQSQIQSQYLSAILECQEKIIAKIPKYAKGTKERSFLEKLKAALPTMKSMTDMTSSVLKIGAAIGLDPATIHKLLGL